jgi:hypothetical protein
MSTPADHAGRRQPGGLRIFISYARKDEAYVSDFREDLERQLQNESQADEAPEVFLDPDVRPGSDWRTRIKKELDRCDFFVPICGRPFFRSPWCSREWGYFRRRLLAATPADRELPERIIPVWWRPLQTIPAVVDRINIEGVSSGRWPPWDVRHQGVLDWRMEGRREGKYPQYVLRLARRILNAFAARDDQLPPLAIDLGSAESAFIPQWSYKDPEQSNLLYMVPSEDLLRARPHLSFNGADAGVYGQDVPYSWKGFRVGQAGAEATHWTVEEQCPAHRVDWMLRRFNIVPGEQPLTPPTSWRDLSGWNNDIPTVVLCDTWASDQPYFQNWLYENALDSADVKERIRNAFGEHKKAGRRDSVRHRVFIVAGSGSRRPVYTFAPVKDPDELTTTLNNGLRMLREHQEVACGQPVRRGNVINPNLPEPDEPGAA